MVAKSGSFEYSIERDEEEVILTVEYSGYHQPAKTYGPPEDCYPEEGEIEIVSISPNIEISDTELECIHDAAWQDFFERDYG